jgi:excisionase family DNA binding protein
MAEQRYFDCTEAGEIMGGLSYDTVRGLCVRGELRHSRIVQGRYRISLEAIDEYMKACEPKPAGPAGSVSPLKQAPLLPKGQEMLVKLTA